ncbi:MAG: hypothetical protein IH855_03170 [Bacteroidetes bacterium]|nr:hypothetical protein [Bacteroidota bacterium]
MRPLHRIISLLVVVAVGLGAEGSASAQGKPPEGTVYTWLNAPLETALYEIADLSGIAVVFAHRLVDRQVVTASYKVGDDPRATLEAMLAGTGLRAGRAHGMVGRSRRAPEVLQGPERGAHPVAGGQDGEEGEDAGVPGRVRAHPRREGQG